MRSILGNRLLVVSIVMVAFYWIIGPELPKPIVSSVMSILSVCAGVLMMSRYFEQFIEILIHQKRSDTGSHWAIFGASLVALGVIWSGLFSLVWIYYQTPPSWSATASSSFGRGLIAIGFWLMAISPDSSRINAGYPYTFWRALIILISIIGAYVAGTHYSPNG